MGDCTCIWVSCDDEWEDGETKRVETLLPQTCCECNSEIPPGNTHEFFWGETDGDRSEYRTCALCVEIRDKLFCDGWLFGQVWDEIDQHIYDHKGKLRSECFEGLSAEARDVLIDRVQDYWDEQDRKGEKPCS